MVIGKHQSHRMITDEWITPPEIIEELGPFDLDPCSPINRPWDTAKKHYTIEDDGLSKDWEGRVWLNPPYGRQVGFWLEKMVQHNHGIALIFARTETQFFHKYIWYKAKGIFFFEGRLFFHKVDGTRAKSNSGAPSCLVAYGEDDFRCLENCNLKGRFVAL